MEPFHENRFDQDDQLHISLADLAQVTCDGVQGLTFVDPDIKPGGGNFPFVEIGLQIGPISGDRSACKSAAPHLTCTPSDCDDAEYISSSKKPYVLAYDGGSV